MSAQIITGHALRRRLLADAAKTAQEAGVTPTVALIRVETDDPMTPVNFRLHERVFTSAGFRVRPYELPRQTTQESLNALIERLNGDDEIDVVFTLIPLPDHLDIRSVLATLDPAKEAEGIHLQHLIRLNPLSALPPTRIPVVPAAIIHLLTEIDYTPEGGQVVVITDPSIETNPIGKMVARVAAFSSLPPDTAGTSVPMTHPRAPELARSADLLIVSLTHAQVVTGEWVKPGAVVIDFNAVFTGWQPNPDDPGAQVPHLVGGIDLDSVREVAGTIIPAPGGVGPVMLGVLAQQIVTAAVERRKVAVPV